MTINDRAKELRKCLGLSQPAFGKKMELSRDVIANIELNRVEVKPHVIKLMSNTFGASEEWLLTGEGDMFQMDEEAALIAELLEDQESPVKDLVLSILRAYKKMDAAGKATLDHYIQMLKEDMN